MSEMMRVLLSNNANLGRVITVDGDGNADFTSIQAAMDAARAKNPTPSQPYTIFIAGGNYSESLVLYDYINLIGLGEASSVKLLQSNQSVMRNGATCTIANLRISGTFSPMINIANSFNGEMTFDRVTIQEELAEINSLVCGGGKVILQNCDWRYGGALVMNGGNLLIQQSSLFHAHNMPLALTQAAIEMHSGSIGAYYSRIENIANPSSGGAGVLFTTAAPLSAKFYYCLLRAASGYSMDSTVTMSAVIAACRMNADINTAKILGGYLDYAFHANI
ncbi:MAG: hypothetical protein ACPL3P_05865 [Anaerolineales bacterium]